MQFSRQYRLLNKEEFKYIFDQPKKIDHRYWVLLYRPNQKGHSRLGLIVAKRTTPNAHDRNRLRRIFRESFRMQREILQQVDIIIIAKQQCYLLPNQRIREGLDKLWEKLRISL